MMGRICFDSGFVILNTFEPYTFIYRDELLTIVDIIFGFQLARKKSDGNEPRGLGTGQIKTSYQ